MPVIKTLKNGVWTKVSSFGELATATSSLNGLMSSADKSKLDKVADYIVEQGSKTTSDGTSWTYTKWHSGLIRAIGGSPSISVTPTALMGGYYANINIKPLPFPIDSTKAYIMLPKGALGTGVTFALADKNGDNAYNITVWGNQNATTASYKIMVEYVTTEV